MNEVLEGMWCGVCNCEHSADEFEQTRGGARIVEIDGEKLEKNWIDIVCRRTGREFQIAWFEGIEEESEEQ